jgi:hypothetical protein
MAPWSKIPSKMSDDDHYSCEVSHKAPLTYSRSNSCATATIKDHNILRNLRQVKIYWAWKSTYGLVACCWSSISNNPRVWDIINSLVDPKPDADVGHDRWIPPWRPAITKESEIWGLQKGRGRKSMWKYQVEKKRNKKSIVVACRSTLVPFVKINHHTRVTRALCLPYTCKGYTISCIVSFGGEQ